MACTAPVRDMITELVGPSGAGKTTLMVTLQRDAVISVFTVPHIFTASGSIPVSLIDNVQSLLRGFAHGLLLSIVYRVQPTAWLRLARNCVAVENASLHVRNLDGSWFVDEGPLRLLRDRQCGAGAELRAWKHFAIRAIKRLGNRRPNLRMIVLDIAPEVRERRFRERTLREIKHRRMVGGFRNLLGLYLDDVLRPAGEPITLGIFVDKIASMSGLVTVQSFECDADETPEQVGRRFIHEVLEDGTPKRFPPSFKETRRS